MKKVIIFAAAGLGLGAAVYATAPRAAGDPSAAWNRKAAAAYLDQRATWWTTWPNAQRDHGTFCVSCHTALPYALARPALRTYAFPTPETRYEDRLLENVTKRVHLWKEIGPYYSDHADKAAESRGTEAVLNALILAHHDARDEQLSEDTRA